MPEQRLARLREEILVIDQERHRLVTQLGTTVSALDAARTAMFRAFSALRRVMRVEADGQRQAVRRDDARHLRDAYEDRKRAWGAIVTRERELRARLTLLDAGRTERLREHRRLYQSLMAPDPAHHPRVSA